MISVTTYNTNVNTLDFAYLRTKINSGFLKVQTPQPMQHFGLDNDEVCNCCDINKNFIQLALADLEESNPLKNDYLSLLYQVPTSASTLTFILQKNTAGGWVNKATLNSTYGTVYNVGIFTDQPLFGGYKLAWRSVLAAFDEGNYRVQTIATGLEGSVNTFS